MSGTKDISDTNDISAAMIGLLTKLKNGTTENSHMAVQHLSVLLVRLASSVEMCTQVEDVMEEACCDGSVDCKYEPYVDEDGREAGYM